MVSTPIGPPELPTPMTTCNIQLSPSKAPIMSTSIQNLPNIPTAVSSSYQSTYMHHSNLLTNIPNAQGHTFPVLYSSPLQFATAPSEIPPPSLYREYMQNPYNFSTTLTESPPRSVPIVTSSSENHPTTANTHHAQGTNSLPVVNQQTQEVSNVPTMLDLNKNAESDSKDEQQNIFQSSNYFCNDQNFLPPPGMEFLYGSEQQNPLIGQNVNIPVSSTPSTD